MGENYEFQKLRLPYHNRYNNKRKQGSCDGKSDAAAHHFNRTGDGYH